jgi:hypothetical protein
MVKGGLLFGGEQLKLQVLKTNVQVNVHKKGKAIPVTGCGGP